MLYIVIAMEEAGDYASRTTTYITHCNAFISL